jgi:hypothetical protein
MLNIANIVSPGISVPFTLKTLISLKSRMFLKLWKSVSSGFAETNKKNGTKLKASLRKFLLLA